jgi:hypothetical protein
MSDTKTLFDSLVSGGQLGTGNLRQARREVSEATLGSSHWVLELCDYRHDAEMIAALQSLADRAAGLNPFFRWESLSASVDRLGPRKLLMILWERLGDSSTMRVAFPVTEEGGGIGRPFHLRVWSHPYAPLGMPLIDQSEPEESISRFVQLLPRLLKANRAVLLAEEFPVSRQAGASLLAKMKQAGLFVATGCHSSRAALVARPGESPRDFLPIFARRKRHHEIARQLRRLGEFGRLEFRRSEGFGDLALRLEEFLLIEARSWKGNRGTSFLATKRTAAFARQMVAALGGRGDAQIHSLRLDGKTIASLIMLRTGGSYFPWKICYDETWHAYSPGVQLMLQATVDLLGTDGFQFADSLAGETSMLDAIWPDRLELASIAVAPQEGRRKATKLMAGLDRRHRIKRWAKRMLGRR